MEKVISTPPSLSAPATAKFLLKSTFFLSSGFPEQRCLGYAYKKKKRQKFLQRIGEEYRKRQKALQWLNGSSSPISGSRLPVRASTCTLPFHFATICQQIHKYANTHSQIQKEAKGERHTNVTNHASSQADSLSLSSIREGCKKSSLLVEFLH